MVNRYGNNPVTPVTLAELQNELTQAESEMDSYKMFSYSTSGDSDRMTNKYEYWESRAAQLREQIQVALETLRKIPKTP